MLIAGYSEEQCVYIQRQHKELLKYSKNKNKSKEVAFVFNSDMSNRSEFIGSDDILNLGTALYGKNLIVLHNHPRNSSYSFNNVTMFISNDSVRILTVVKNNGNVETLTKLEELNTLLLMKELHRLEKSTIKVGTDSEYRKIVNKFLNK